jgi:streptogrisin D
LIAGGDAILGASSRCSLGFNVLRGGVRHLLTAGHCGKTIATWSTPSASTIGFSFPGDDYALVRYTCSTATDPATATGSAGSAVVGQTAKKSGSTTQVSTGSVQGLNQTVNYPQGTVGGLIRTSVCAQPGDSGGALFAGTVALGLVSGGRAVLAESAVAPDQAATRPASVCGSGAGCP